jgi:hypothetical protein
MNLNRHNTFTPEWEQRFPNVAKHFKKWIDEYKKSIPWSILFQTLPWSMISNLPATKEDYKTHDRGLIVPYQWKFHDIPIELQYGIICKWLNSFRYHYTMNCPVTVDLVLNSFIWWCQFLESSVYGKTEK